MSSIRLFVKTGKPNSKLNVILFDKSKSNSVSNKQRVSFKQRLIRLKTPHSSATVLVRHYDLVRLVNLFLAQQDVDVRVKFLYPRNPRKTGRKVFALPLFAINLSQDRYSSLTVRTHYYDWPRNSIYQSEEFILTASNLSIPRQVYSAKRGKATATVCRSATTSSLLCSVFF